MRELSTNRFAIVYKSRDASVSSSEVGISLLKFRMDF